MIAVVSPPAIVRCLDHTGREKAAFFERSVAKRHRRPGQRCYRCPLCGWFHVTSRPAA